MTVVTINAKAMAVPTPIACTPNCDGFPYSRPLGPEGLIKLVAGFQQIMSL